MEYRLRKREVDECLVLHTGEVEGIRLKCHTWVKINVLKIPVGWEGVSRFGLGHSYIPM